MLASFLRLLHSFHCYCGLLLPCNVINNPLLGCDGALSEWCDPLIGNRFLDLPCRIKTCMTESCGAVPDIDDVGSSDSVPVLGLSHETVSQFVSCTSHEFSVRCTTAPLLRVRSFLFTQHARLVVPTQTRGLSILPWHGGVWMALRSNLPLSHVTLHHGARDARMHVSAAQAIHASFHRICDPMHNCVPILAPPVPSSPGGSPRAPGRRNLPCRFTVDDGGLLDTPTRTMSRMKASGRSESTQEPAGALSGGRSVHVSLSSGVSTQVRLLTSHFPFRFLRFPFKCDLGPFRRFPIKRKFERKGGSVRNVSEVSQGRHRRRL